MKYELWYSEPECFGILLAEGDTASLKGSRARLLWTVEASTYQEAVQKRDAFLEGTDSTFVSLRDRDALRAFFASGAYRPDRSSTAAARGSTTRATIVVYLDDDGERRSLEVPGWANLTPELVAQLAEAGAGLSAILEQIFLERPYRDLAGAPAEITVVDLRSHDGNARMIQELSGHLHDQAQISELVSQRLGPAVAHWRIVQATLMRRNDDAGEPGASPPKQETAASGAEEQPCPCGSGKSFAGCHGAEQAQ